MRIIQTDTPPPPSEVERLWLYNGLDCCVTHEVFGVIQPQLDNLTQPVYEFEKSLQGPVLDMKLRGVLINSARRESAINELEASVSQIKANFGRLLTEGLGHPPINFASPIQVRDLLYGYLRLPPKTKQGKPTVDREALESLQTYFIAQPLISHILALRDLTKTLGVLKSEIDTDGRFRTSYNIAGTSTGRFSSNISDLGTGSNSQNLDPRLRSIFISDPGMKLAYIDLEQAESRAVGAIEWNLFNDSTYLDACEGSDLHTTVAKLVWPLLDWKYDPRHNRSVANLPFHRQHSYRQAAKVLGHGSNYQGTPATMAKHTKIPLDLIKAFQPRYFGAFPAHPQWHAHVANELASDGYLVSLTGRRRHFFGRLTDPATIREAIAFNPQGSVADILNTGMLKVWRLNICQLLFQIHDAILVQYPERAEDEILPRILKEIVTPVELNGGRILTIPAEVKVGWNWGEFSDGNPDGLKIYGAGDARRRSETPTFLDRKFR
jgi:DNA polymerase I